MRKVIIYVLCVCLSGCMVKKSTLECDKRITIDHAEVATIKIDSFSRQHSDIKSVISIEEKITEKDTSGSVVRYTERVYKIRQEEKNEKKDSVLSSDEKVVKSQEKALSQVRSTSEKKPNIALWSVFSICVAVIIWVAWRYIKKRLFFL
ncbi:MAG: hypothetical protein PHD21_05700 [Flavobacteriales bacterium]|nr:hypothetical protein [Flavobacteriales bacterium]